MCCQIKCHGQAGLSRGQVTPVKRIGLFSRRVAGVLTDRPRSTRVHCGPWASKIRGEPWQGISLGHIIKIGSRVQRLDSDSFRGLPTE